MRALAINGSPRKGWNTEVLLKEALRGAESNGADTKLVQLYDLNYTGCKSCFACKRLGTESYHCGVKDDLSSVLDEIFQSDVVFLGSPIYFGDITGQMACLLERLAFPLLSYDDYTKRLFDGKINAAFFFTMNVPEAYYKSNMEPILKNRTRLLHRLGGTVEVYAACDTYQFSDYSKYHTGRFDAVQKRKVRDEQFPNDMKNAFEIGQRLSIIGSNV